MPWTKKQENKLRKLNVEKYSFLEIAKKLGMTRNKIAGKSHRLGLKSQSGYAFTGNRWSRPAPDLKTDRAVLAKIKKHTDKLGWGLEISEIIEYTQLPFSIILHAVKRLVKSGHIKSCTSFVAGHVFYNDASIEQVGS